jgi:hypothetical protein
MRSSDPQEDPMLVCHKMCCPSPNEPHIQPTPDTLRYRKLLYILMYCEGVACVLKCLLYGLMSGIFGLFGILFIYWSYATMNFC